jgi:hypothetical protein
LSSRPFRPWIEIAEKNFVEHSGHVLLASQNPLSSELLNPSPRKESFVVEAIKANALGRLLDNQAMQSNEFLLESI